MSESSRQRNYGTRLFFGLLAIVFIAGLVFVLRPVKTPSASFDSVFNGWVYGREDQKNACAVMAKAGLSAYRWEKGILSVPCSDKHRYEQVLAEGKAFPQAPSDMKRDALREMNQFESTAKMRLRDLYSAAWQLERMIGLSEQVGYATVGVRSRTEQVGLVQKNIVTASIGVWPVGDEPLSPELLSAITMAARHQLGITENENISIFDLRRGCSWLGTNVGLSNTSTGTVARRQEEEYWDSKMKAALNHISGIRVQTTVAASPEGTESENTVVGMPRRTSACLGNRVPSTFVSCYPAPRYSGVTPSPDNRANTVTPGTGTEEKELVPVAVSLAIPESYLQELMIHRNIVCVGQEEYQARRNEILTEIRRQAVTLLQPILAGSRRTPFDASQIISVTTCSAPAPGEIGFGRMPEQGTNDSIVRTPSPLSLSNGTPQKSTTAPGTPSAAPFPTALQNNPTASPNKTSLPGTLPAPSVATPLATRPLAATPATLPEDPMNSSSTDSAKPGRQDEKSTAAAAADPKTENGKETVPSNSNSAPHSCTPSLSLKEQVSAFWLKNKNKPLFWEITGGAVAFLLLLALVRKAVRSRKRKADRIETRTESARCSGTIRKSDERNASRLDRLGSEIEDSVEFHSSSTVSAAETSAWSNLESDVQKLVKDNPERAVEIIQRWIQTGT